MLVERLLGTDSRLIPRFSFEGINTLARVVSIYDPDTITIAFEFDSRIIKISVRLEGIDAPERRSKNPNETAACKAGITFMETIMTDIVRVELGKFDKYGRALCRVFTMKPLTDCSLCVNDLLTAHRFVHTYYGGSKKEWSQSELTEMIR